jgi:hypothetical protein
MDPMPTTTDTERLFVTPGTASSVQDSERGRDMADTLVKWKRGASGLYDSMTMYPSDWESLGFTGEDTTIVVFDRTNNFTVVGDTLPGVQLDFFENDSEYEVKQITNPAQAQVSETRAQAINRAGVTGGDPERQVVDFSEVGEGSTEEPTRSTVKAMKAKDKAAKA